MAPPPDPFRARRLVVFDLDGTLYRQGPLRRRMLRLLLADAMRRRDTTTLRVLGVFRRQREAMSEAGRRGFEPVLFAETALACHVPEDRVRAIVDEWIGARPLPLLRRCRVAGAAELFAALRGGGVTVAVLSDYPAREKLAALGLEADHIVSATDPEVGVLKPDPAGLARVLSLAGCPAEAALMVGDRPERDGAAAAALGVDFLRRGRALPGVVAVRDFTDPRLAALWGGG